MKVRFSYRSAGEVTARQGQAYLKSNVYEDFNTQRYGN
jgi:hypothetical protein